MSLTEDINNYITWCNEKGLNKNNPKSLDLFIKEQMNTTDQNKYSFYLKG